MGMTSDGGKPKVRDVNRYATPQGPLTLGDRGPGLHANNYGNAGTQGKSANPAESSGSPGLHGDKPNLPQGTH